MLFPVYLPDVNNHSPLLLEALLSSFPLHVHSSVTIALLNRLLLELEFFRPDGFKLRYQPRKGNHFSPPSPFLGQKMRWRGHDC